EIAREAAFWEEKLGGLADSIKPTAPPTQTWSRIEAAIAEPQKSTRSRTGLWQSLVFWRSFAFITTVAALACVAALGTVLMRPPPDSGPLLAQLDQPSKQPGFVAAVGRGGTLVIVPASLLAPDQKSFELWLIPAGDKPHSLGLIAPTQA